jgi:protoporphyrinogen oxidase
MQQNIRKVDVNYAGMTKGCKSENYTVPDLTLCKVDFNIIKKELKEIASKPDIKKNETLSDYLDNRFGLYAAKFLKEAAYKKLQYDPTKLDATAASLLFFDRVKLFDEKTSIKLKEQKFYDERLAVFTNNDAMQFYSEAAKFYPFRNFYPDNGGMRQFCDGALEYLKEQGAKLIFEQSIESISKDQIQLKNGDLKKVDRLIWAAELDVLESILFDENSLKQFIHPVPMVVVYFEVPVKNIGSYTYFHDHTPEQLIFRASAPGLYSGQVIDGKSYICCEVPTHLNSNIWLNAKAYINTIWQEACNLKICSGEMPSTYKLLQAPITFKLPLVGYQKKFEKIQQKILKDHSNIICIDPVQTSLTDIASNILKELES